VGGLRIVGSAVKEGVAVDGKNFGVEATLRPVQRQSIIMHVTGHQQQRQSFISD
jgi:hypothetical protein